MATLEEIQEVELEMMSFLDSTCEKLGIKYNMMGGTMLGAVRHKGFIPWDDDIDVCMNLRDFRKLENGFSSECYFLQTPRTDREEVFAMYKLRKNGTNMVEPNVSCLNIHHGIWIDIFVYVNAARGQRLRRLQYTLFSCLRSYRCRFLHARRDPGRRVYVFLAKWPSKLSLAVDGMILKAIEIMGSKKSDSYFMLDVGKQYIYKKEFFDDIQRYEFENHKFLGVRNYDEYLTQIYGKDYMTPKKWGHIPDYSEVQL